MCNQTWLKEALIKTLSLIIGLFITLNAWAMSPNEIIQLVDQKRQVFSSILVKTRIILHQKGKTEKVKDYDVYIADQTRSLVIFKNKREKGQKVLMLGDNFYLIMPKSRRPLRITPLQKLLGEAASGDIATLRWAADYDGKILSEDEQHWQLELTGHRKGLSYSKIHLWVDKQTISPQKAGLYVASGKLAKVATFKLNASHTQVEKMILRDKIQKNHWTEILYLQQKPVKISNKIFNPQYLVQHKKIRLP